MINILIAIAVVAYILSRQLKAQPLKETSSLRLMAILGVVGLIDIRNAFHGHTVGATTVALIAVSLIVAGALGAARALTMKVWRASDGTAWRQGTWVTAAMWIFAIAIHFGFDLAINASTSISSLGSATILAYLAVSLGAQREIVRLRAPQLVA